MARKIAEPPDPKMSRALLKCDLSPHGFCFVLSWPFSINGGVNQVVNNLIREMETRPSQEWKPVHLELTWTPSRQGGVVTQMRLNAPYLRNRPVRSVVRFLVSLPASLWRLRKLATEKKIRVFNIHFPDLEALNFVLLRDLRLFGGKIILSFHGSDIRSALQQRGLSKWLWKFLLRRSDAVVACSDGLREEVAMLEPRSKAITIYNGVDPAALAAASVRSCRWPDRLAGKKVIISVGAFEYRKGHDLLIRAFRRVASCHKNIALVLVGKPGSASDAIRNMAEDNNSPGEICILEDVPHREIYDLMKRSDVFVLASRWEKGKLGEGFAIAGLEAAAAGLPVVATASCGVTELIENGKTGRVVSLENEEELADAIGEMLSNHDRAVSMGRNLHARVSDHFTWSKALDNYLALCSGPTYSI